MAIHPAAEAVQGKRKTGIDCAKPDLRASAISARLARTADGKGAG